jgi:hypothetical protein
MFKALILASSFALVSPNLALAGGNPSPGAVSEGATILGAVNVATANQAIASVGLGGAMTLTGSTATITRSPSGDITVTSDTGSSFTVSAGFVAQLLLAYFT